MTILTWKLATEPPQKPEYWLLFVDGFAWVSLHTVAPYAGVGDYSADLSLVDTPLIPGPHQLSVALVGQNSIGPQSAAVLATISAVAVSVVSVQAPAIVWPAADSISIQQVST
jgi:hypothetical protein